MDQIFALAIQVIAGLIGGNVAGTAMKESSLGTVGNSVAGAIGGVGLGQVLQLILASDGADAANAAAGMNVGGLVTDVLGGGVGGAILSAIVGFIKGQSADAG